MYLLSTTKVKIQVRFGMHASSLHYLKETVSNWLNILFLAEHSVTKFENICRTFFISSYQLYNLASKMIQLGTRQVFFMINRSNLLHKDYKS